MDQGTLAPGDHARYLDDAGGGVEYEAMLDQHGNTICCGHPDPWGAAMLVFSSASMFVRQSAGLDSRPSSRHYGSLYVNGLAWPTPLQGARDMDPQRPNGEVSDAHWRHHTQPCDANDVQGGAEGEEKGKVLFSSTTTYGACVYR